MADDRDAQNVTDAGVAPPEPEQDDTELSTPEEAASSAPPPVAGPVPAPTAAPPQGQPPIQVVAAHPKASLFHGLLTALGGGDKTQYSVVPQTGAMSVTKVPQTTGQLSKSILAGALT